MYYALGTVHPAHVSNVVILAAVIAAMGFWRLIIKAVIGLLVGAVTIGLATGVVMLLHG